MTHPITPPPELVQQWASEWMQLQNVNRDNFMATRAAQYGANQELEACCEWLLPRLTLLLIAELRAARRPKPPSLKQQALLLLSQMEEECEMTLHASTIRRALEALPDE
jgi:hypothetical protein